MGYNQVVGLLIERGANVNLLSLGVCRCRIPRCLLRNDGVPDTRHRPCSVLHLALSRMHISTARLITEYGKPMYAVFQPGHRRPPWAFGSVPESELPPLEPHHKGLSIIERLFSEGYRHPPRIMHHPVNCHEWLARKELRIPRHQEAHRYPHDHLGPSWHSCFSNTCNLISYAIDAQIVWSRYGTYKPLIHVYLHLPYGRELDWRRLGASLQMVRRSMVYSDLPLLELYIGKGADVNARNSQDYHSTPLMVAAWTGGVLATDLLISKGADVNATDDMGYTALHAAATGGNRDVVIKLLRKGAQVNAANKKGMSSLHFLCRTMGNDHDRQSLQIIELLLSYGADPMFRIDFPARQMLGPYLEPRTSFFEAANLSFACLKAVKTRPHWRCFCLTAAPHVTEHAQKMAETQSFGPFKIRKGPQY
ncbi:ankyrin repeat-containing domain protein [Hypoxylon sp. NC0597]|nr:ankyrin repeat-containing domain protein [Hypoxylon sp. NC0597]